MEFNLTQTQRLDVAVKKFTGNLLDNIFQANLVTRKADEAAVKDKVKTYCKMIKQNWSSGSEEKYNEDCYKERRAQTAI